MRTAHEQHVVVAAALGEELGEASRAVAEHNLDFAGKRAPDARPGVERLREGIAGDEVSDLKQRRHDLAGARAARAQRRAGDPIVHEQDPSRPVLMAPGMQRESGLRCMVRRESRAVLPLQRLAVPPLEACGHFRGLRARELVVKGGRVGVVHDAEALVPEPQAVVRLLAVCGREVPIEAPQALEEKLAAP